MEKEPIRHEHASCPKCGFELDLPPPDPLDRRALGRVALKLDDKDEGKVNPADSSTATAELSDFLTNSSGGTLTAAKAAELTSILRRISISPAKIPQEMRPSVSGLPKNTRQIKDIEKGTFTYEAASKIAAELRSIGLRPVRIPERTVFADKSRGTVRERQDST